MDRILCELQTMWHTAIHWFLGGSAIVEGHTYKEVEVHKNVTVYISKCVNCGKSIITWSK